MAWAPLVYLGRISYGLYLWHYTVYYIVKKNVTVLPYKPLLQISLSIIVAVISYHLFEVRFLKLKDRMRQSEVPGSTEATESIAVRAEPVTVLSGPS